MTILDANKILMEVALSKALRDMRTDPDRTVRSLLDLGSAWAKGDLQQAFFAQLKTMLQDEKSAYYTLLKHAAGNVKFDILKALGMNLGYNGCTVGAKTARSQKEKYGINIPRSISFEMDGSITVKEIDGIMEQGKQLGIYLYQLRCGTEKAVHDLPWLFARQKDCAFLVYLRPQAVDDALIEEYNPFCNHMLAVACHEHDAREAFARLHQAGFLYGTNFEYGPDNAAHIFSNDYYEYAVRTGALFALSSPKADAEAPLRKRVYEHIVKTRLEQRYPVLAIELGRDALEIARMSSGDACLVGFDGQGALIDLHGLHEEAQGNMTQHSLLQILCDYHRKKGTGSVV